MKKIIVLFLITIFLCANTSVGQLLKVPNLLEHYKEHKRDVAVSSITFIQFIKNHYSKNSQNSNEEHQDLPFKTFDNTTNVLFTISFANFQMQLIKPLISHKKEFCYNKSFKSKLFISIWMPPKIS